MKSSKNNFSITIDRQGRLPRLPFSAIKTEILGKDYELSLVFVSPKKSAELNKSFRGKTGPTDILSFPIEPDNGEIFICLPEVRRQAPLFDKSFKKFLGFLFIHGLLHLKGFVHSSKMEAEETRYRKKFSF